MSDQCRACTERGDLVKCLAAECFSHESWIVRTLLARVEELEAERDTWVELRAVSDMRVKELRARVEELEARLEIPGPGDSPPLQADVVLCAMVFGAKYKNKGSTFPLWSHVGELAAHGSGYSAAICRWVGLNPDTGEPLEGGEEDE